MNPWTNSFEQYRQDILGENKKKSDKKEPRWQDDDCDNKWYEKSDVDGKISKREKKEKAKHYSKEEVVTEKISASGYARAKKWREAQAAQKDREDNAKWEEKARTHKWDGKTWNKRDKPTHDEGQGPHAKKLAAHNAKNESVEVNHIDGSKTQIIDVIRAPKMPDAREMMEGKMKQARKNVGASTCWDGYKAKGTKMKGGKVVPNCEKEEVEINEMDGSKLGIGLAAGVVGGGASLIKSTIDAGKRLKQNIQKRTGAKEQFSNWREDFIWEGPATAKDPKLDVKETGVKNKIEVNPEVKTEEKKKLTKTAPLSDRVHNWSKTKKTEDYHSGKGEIKQKRTLNWMKKKGMKGAPGLDAYKERQKEHEDNRGKGKKKVSEGSAYGITRGSGVPSGPMAPFAKKKKKKEDVKEAKVDKKLPDYKRATVRDKRYGNPHGSHELGGGIRKDRRADHEERRRKKTKAQESVKYYSGQDRDPKTGLPKGLKATGSGSKKERPLTGVDYSSIQASYEPRFSVFDEAADRKMARATDQQLADAHKKFSGMDQSSPANAHMTKRITREITRRRKAAKSTQGTSPVKEEVGVSSSASITKAKQEAELQRKEALAKKKKGVKEHHQKDSNGKVIEHGDGTPSSVEENVVKKVFDKAKEVWNRPIMAPTITKDQHLKKIRKSGGDTSHWEETEVVSELNRYEKETGKSSGSLNMPKGKKTKKGGDSSQVMRSVRTSIRRETGKPEGQRKTRKKGEKTPDMKGPSAKLQKSINNLKSKRDLDAKAKKAGYKSTQDYVNVKARYPD